MPSERRRQLSILEQIGHRRGGLAPGEESQLITLRLPLPQHARLRQWCGDHDLSMAAVVRGLIDRFLDSQPDSRQPDASVDDPGSG